MQKFTIQGQQQPTYNPVEHPEHYVKNGVECIDVIKALVSDMNGFDAYCAGNVLKYLWRYQHKNGLEDLEKAAKYLEFLKYATEVNSELS